MINHNKTYKLLKFNPPMSKFSVSLLAAVLIVALFTIFSSALVSASTNDDQHGYGDYRSYGNDQNYFNHPDTFHCFYNDHSGCDFNTTVISGKVFNSTNKTVANATVMVTCQHNGTNSTQTTTTLWNGPFKGTFLVKFSDSICESKDKVFVTASSGNFVGTTSGTVKDLFGSEGKHHRFFDVDLAVVKVYLNMVPEFGLLAGALTMVSAVGIFFVVRRK